MIVFIAFVLVAVSLLDRVHADIGAECAQRHSFRLYALRDDLREAVIGGHVRCDNWVFEYLDSSIAKTIAYLPTFSIWSLAYIAITYRGDETTMRAAAHLESDLQRPGNACLAEIHARYIDELGHYLLERHLIVRLMVNSVLVSLRAGNGLLRLWQRALELSTEAPETSTLADFATA